VRLGLLCMTVAGGSSADGAAMILAGCTGSGAQHFNLNTSYDLVNLGATKCVDVKDAQTSAGTPLQLWTCTGGSNQKWGKG